MKPKKFEVKIYHSCFCTYKIEAKNEAEAIIRARNRQIDSILSYICDRIKTTLIYIESNIATISNDVGLCFRLGQMSNGSSVFRFSIKHFREISFFKMHFAKS